jgi:cyanophycinase-like exopeptidase
MGTIALMGSGELTSTMVEVHKALLSRLPGKAAASFLDTPAGFQLNADQISANAAEYFRNRVGHTLQIASYKSRETTPEMDAALAFQRLRESDYVLMGPGSPTYTVEQLGESPIPQILVQRIRDGGCLVAASAAALTVGRFTLPVYEIYKVGQPLHWVPGLDLLGAFGLSLVVVPHWNNAEGGTHDTSRCFMGRSRFERLEALLEEPVPVLGLDEHTACIIDLAEETFTVRGIGSVRLQQREGTQVFTAGTPYPLDVLRGGGAAPSKLPITETYEPTEAPARVEGDEQDFWRRVHERESEFHKGIAAGDVTRSAQALLELDRMLWKAQGDMENPDVIAQARDLFRELLVLVGTRCLPTLPNLQRALAPLVEDLLASRQRFRDGGLWDAADAVRDALARTGIVVEDTSDGPRWHLEPGKEDTDDPPS